jgi:hypothetical protein
MSWHYLQGQAAASWAGSYSDGVPDALSKLIPMPAPCCSHGSATGCSSPSRSGMTCARSMADRGEARSRYAFVENSADLVSRGLDVVLGDLAALGFDARWGVLGARDAGAPHTRDRVWVLAHPGGEYGRQGMADPEGLALAAIESSAARARARRDGEPWHDPSPPALRVADGMAHRVDRIRAIGNGQVPRVVALAFETLAGAL